MAGFAAGKDHFTRVPVHAHLLGHPTAGPIPAGTGIGPGQAGHTACCRGPVIGHVRDAGEYGRPAARAMTARPARPGCQPPDVRGVIVTRFREDHTGPLTLSGHAPAYPGKDEDDAREDSVFGLPPPACPPSTASVRDWHPIEGTGPPAGGFDGPAGLGGNGTVTALPTPGRGPGSTGVLVRGERGFLLTGDARYTVRHLAADQVRAIPAGGTERYAESIRRIQRLRRELPGLVIATAHDHPVHGKRRVAGLADGSLPDEDCEWLKAYERGTFDELCNINPARPPRFVPGADGEQVGDVV